MNTRPLSALLLIASGILACDIFEPKPSPPLGNASIAEMRAELGTYSVTEIPIAASQFVRGPNANGAVLISTNPPAAPATKVWKGGVTTDLVVPGKSFRGTAMNGAGDVVGKLDSAVAIWRAGSASPVELFSDPAQGKKFETYSINDRGEVLLRNFTSLCSGHGVWKDGEFKSISESKPWVINNHGIILRDTCNGLYDTWTLSDSPFGAEPVMSGKLSGRRCEYPSVHGRLSYGRFLNDSNEVVDSDNAWVTAAGCARVGRIVLAMNARGILIVYPAQYVCTAASCDIAVELMTVNGHVPLDSLLAAAADSYRVAGAVGVNDAGQIAGFVIRKSDNTRVAALFSRVP